MPADHPQDPMVAQALAAATDKLNKAGVTDPRLDAELMLSHLLESDRAALVVRRKEPLTPMLAKRYERLVKRRAKREPLQHIVGSQEFYGLEFEVDKRVLIPRQETEGLVDAVLDLSLPPGARVADLGTGSGCIILAIGAQRGDLELLALERSVDALQVARANASRLGLAERVEFHQGNLPSPPGDWRGTIDCVVCNPPYVSEGEWSKLQPEVREYDPRDALISGPTGLESYAAVAPVAFELLREGGHLVLELGFGQTERVGDLVQMAGLQTLAVRPDLRQIPRVLIARKPGIETNDS